MNTLSPIPERFPLEESDNKRMRFLADSSVKEMKKMNDEVIELFDDYNQSFQRK